MPRTVRYCRPRSSPEETLLEYLQFKFSYLSSAQWVEHISAGHLTVSSVQPSSPQHVLQQGDVIIFSPPKSMEPPVDEENINIIYEDDAIVVCTKNGSIPVTEGGRYCENTLVAVLDRNGTHRYYNDHTVRRVAQAPSSALSSKRQRDEHETTTPREASVRLSEPGSSERSRKQRLNDKTSHSYSLFPVHRLDKETSGVVVLAKSRY